MNICNQSAKAPALALFLLFGSSLLAWSQGGHASPITGIASPGQPILIDWSGQQDDDTGVKVLNQEVSGDNSLSIELLQNDPVLNLPGPEGFVLLDNTLRVTSTNPAGKRRIRIRMDFGRYLRDGSLSGIRANSIRLLRTDNPVSGRWLPAVRRINEERIADVRYLRVLEDDDFVLGHHGIDLKRAFAWAITDTRGDQFFAIGGLAVIPVPAAWLLFLSGSGLMWLVTRKRRQPVTAL